MVEKVLPYVVDGIWLDIGFGNGSLVLTAQEYGFHAIGLDVREDNVRALRALGVEAHAEPLSKAPLQAQCSVISMADVLEHIPFPGQTLAEAWDRLSDDGVLLISMPNRDSAAWQMLDRQNLNPYWGEIEHYHNFGRARLYALLSEYGFEPIRYGVSERYRVCMEVIARKRPPSFQSLPPVRIQFND